MTDFYFPAILDAAKGHIFINFLKERKTRYSSSAAE